MQILVDLWDSATHGVAQQCGTQDPHGATNNIICTEFAVIHTRRPRDRWYKRADNRHKAGNDNGFRAVFLVKGVGALQLFLELRIPFTQLVSSLPADDISRLIAEDRGSHRKQDQPSDVELTGGGENAGGHEQ